jgi:hypothetical protein
VFAATLLVGLACAALLPGRRPAPTSPSSAGARSNARLAGAHGSQGAELATSEPIEPTDVVASAGR